MKDSLQPGRTAYEILGVAEDIGSDGIIKAFRLAMPGSRDFQALSEARNTLSDASQRLLADLFLYQDSFLDSSRPWQLDRETLIDRRKELARQIEDAYRSEWWDFRCLHTLAVLWYWWAVAREERTLADLKKQPEPVCPILPGSVENPWENAIMCWSALIAAPDFWLDWARIKQYEIPRDAADRLQAHLVSRLNNYADEYNKVQSPKDFARIQKFEELLRNETSTAKRLAASDIRLQTPEGKPITVGFGRQSLEWFGLNEIIGRELARLLELQPDNQNIKLIAKDLSAYGQMHQLAKNRKYDQVIKQIMALPQKEINKEEVQQILLAAYLDKGSQQAEMSQWSAAVVTFIQALQNCAASNAPIIRKTATDLLRPYIAKLQLSDQPAADSLLDKAFVLLDDAPDLLSKANDLHINQAIAMINDVAEADSQKPELSRNQAIEKVKQGIAMLESSAKHGSKRAQENLSKAKSLLNSIQQGIWGVSGSVQSRMNQAIELANKGKFHEAIQIMDEIQSQIPKGEQSKFNGIFGDICNAYGVQLLNDAAAKTNKSKDAVENLAVNRKAVNKFMRGSKGTTSTADIFGFLFKLLILFWVSYGLNWLAGRIPVIQENAFLKTIVMIVIAVIALIIVIRMIKSMSKRAKAKRASKKRGWYDPPSCVKSGCKNFAQYKFDLSKYGYKEKVELCERHGNELQKLIAPKLDAEAGLTLYFAIQQLKRASSLSPNNSTIRENLRAAEEFDSRYK